MSRHTSPPGYDSNYAAILDLLRFGPAIWSCAQFQALLFHAERSTSYGKDSDKHSEEQAMNGVYSVQQLRWIRGPLGVSRASWYRANAELELDQEEARRTPNGVLRKHRSGKGRGQVIEYAIDWLAVRRRIDKWKEGSKIETFAETGRQKEGSQFETLSGKEGSQPETFKGLTVRPFSGDAAVENKGAAGKEGSHSETHSQSLTLKSDLNSPSDASLEAAINLELELACGERVRTDGLAKRILATGRKLRMPGLYIVSRIIHEKAEDLRAKKKHFNPALLAKIFSEESIPWLRKNQSVLDEYERDMMQQRDRAAAPREMQSAEAKAQQPLIDEPKPDPQLGIDLVQEVLGRRAKGAR